MSTTSFFLLLLFNCFFLGGFFLSGDYCSVLGIACSRVGICVRLQ